MTLHHLLALVLISLSHVGSIYIVHRRPSAPDFWWDLTLDHKALVSRMIFSPLTSEIIDKHGEDLDSQKYNWDLRFAHGTSIQWLAGGHGFWSAWTWSSSQNQDITGGGFIFNETQQGLVAGVSWLHDAHSDSIVWNCFVDGDTAGPIPWNDWRMRLEDSTEIGFQKDESKWGFITGEHTVMSKHCAAGGAVVGKRYRSLNGREVASSVTTDSFKTIHRRRRSPDWLDKISKAFKSMIERIKNFFSSDEQNAEGGQENPEGREGGKKCNSLLDLMVRIIDLILGRNRGPGATTEGPPAMPPPPGGVPQGPNGEIPEPDAGGGDPPSGAEVPPPDAEELDPNQNEAIRDWE